MRERTLKLVAVLRTVFGQRHDLGAVFGHQNRVLELRRRFAVFGANGPSVAAVDL